MIFELKNQENFKVPPMSRASVRAQALYVRTQLGLKDVTYIKLAHLIELVLGKFDDFIDFEVVSQGTLGELEAATLVIGHGRSKILLNEDVYEGLRNENPRDRFTVGHELAHAFLHSTLYGQPREYVSTDWPAFRSSEWQANEFSAELLAPAHLIVGITSAEEISSTFGVSMDVARRRIINAVK